LRHSVLRAEGDFSSMLSFCVVFTKSYFVLTLVTSYGPSNHAHDAPNDVRCQTLFHPRDDGRSPRLQAAGLCNRAVEQPSHTSSRAFPPWNPMQQSTRHKTSAVGSHRVRDPAGSSFFQLQRPRRHSDRQNHRPGGRECHGDRRDNLLDQDSVELLLVSASVSG